MLYKKSHCEFARGDSREIDSSSMLDKIVNRAYKAVADWLNHFHSPWEFEDYQVESQNDHYV